VATTIVLTIGFLKTTAVTVSHQEVGKIMPGDTTKKVYTSLILSMPSLVFHVAKISGKVFL
jgi:hypothetical protein